MNNNKLTNLVKTTHAKMVKHSPEILTVMGITAAFTSTVLAVKATPKALQLIEDKKEELEVDSLTPVETVQTTWKCYIPAAVTGFFSTVCLLGANSVNSKRATALATAYKISETALAEYQEQVIETLGEKKEKSIRDKIDEKRLEKNPATNNNVIITSKGNTLCYDAFAGRYFTSDIDKIKTAVNVINNTMLHDMYVSLNDFYEEIDLGYTDAGDELGWHIDDGLLEIEFGTHLVQDNGPYNGTPCIVINFNHKPQYDFAKLYR